MGNIMDNEKKRAAAELERTYKDSVFVTVFQEKEKLIELYNALFDTDYDINTPVNIVTIKDVLFRTLKKTKKMLYRRSLRCIILITERTQKS